MREHRELPVGVQNEHAGQGGISVYLTGQGPAEFDDVAADMLPRDPVHLGELWLMKEVGEPPRWDRVAVFSRGGWLGFRLRGPGRAGTPTGFEAPEDSTSSGDAIMGID